ncbi:alpha/beta hydrolase [Mycobacterium sp. 050134]|uniref:alpha/beta hydrolase n=1 Tax=Mycobacterium sp. 050134 TaxID=3096111 RepID=UPI002ED9E606
MAEQVEFDAEGVKLRGLFFPASDSPAAAVVMAHGLGGEVAHFITEYAEVLAAEGISALVYDHRNWGLSDTAPGAPRNESEPFQQIRDYQHAVTYVQNRPDVYAERVGAWGTSLSAGHVYVLGAIDRRVKAVVGQSPFVSGSRTFGDLTRVDMRDSVHALFAADRRARALGEEPTYLPIVDKDPLATSTFPNPDAYQYFMGPGGVAERDSSFTNRITARSIENCFGYEPGWYLPHIAPTPVLMVVALRDSLTDPALALAAYERAAQPKQLVTIDCGHFGVYSGPDSEVAKAAARDFFVLHLGASK